MNHITTLPDRRGVKAAAETQMPENDEDLARLLALAESRSGVDLGQMSRDEILGRLLKR